VEAREQGICREDQGQVLASIDRPKGSLRVDPQGAGGQTGKVVAVPVLGGLHQVCQLATESTGFDFAPYGPSTITIRRLGSRRRPGAFLR